MTSLTYKIGDARQLIAGLSDESVNLSVFSPPFLSLRSYLGDDDPAKQFEIGMEQNPGEFLQSIIDVMDVLAPKLTADGSVAVELGDTFADSGGAGGDYGPGGKREGQPKYRANRGRSETDVGRNVIGGEKRPGGHHQGGMGWPLGKSMCIIPHLFAGSLAYGRNLLTGEPCGQWRVRNVICWARPNPTPGAQGDKFRVGTSYVTVVTKKRERYWNRVGVDNDEGVPPLDWEVDGTDSSTTWIIPGQGIPNSPIASESSESHYAVMPFRLAERLVRAMCPPGGMVLDPFCGSGTTLEACMAVGVSGMGFDLDAKNAEVARERVGMFLDIDYGPANG